MAEDVDYEVVARATVGMVGAELANVIEIAAINMIRDGRTEVVLLSIKVYLVNFWSYIFLRFHYGKPSSQYLPSKFVVRPQKWEV